MRKKTDPEKVTLRKIAMSVAKLCPADRDKMTPCEQAVVDHLVLTDLIWREREGGPDTDKFVLRVTF